MRPGPSKVEFTGRQVGTAVSGQEATAFVKVKRMVENIGLNRYHFCLKYNGDGENDFTVTRFETPFEEENPIAPSTDDVIHQP